MDESEIKAYLEGEDPIGKAFGLYMTSEGVRTGKQCAELAGIPEHTLKNCVHKGRADVMGGRPWRELRQELHQVRAKEMIKASLPAMAGTIAEGSKVIEAAIHRIQSAIDSGEIASKDLPKVIASLVGSIEKLIKIKRLEVGESTSNAEVHSRQIQNMDLNQANNIIDGIGAFFEEA